MAIVVLSGGSRGLGQALVRDRLERGDTVATFSRSCTPFIEELKADDELAERFHWEPVDSLDSTAVTKFARGVIRRYGRIDSLINNAGIAADGILTMMSEDQIRIALMVNLESAILLTRACIKGMLAQRSGRVVNISSVNAIRGHSGLSVYSATKAALLGFTSSLAREVGPQGIAVNSLAPGFFESDMVEHLTDSQRARIIRRTPLRSLCTIGDLVEAVDFLLSSRSITGQTLVVDGGFSC